MWSFSIAAFFFINVGYANQMYFGVCVLHKISNKITEFLFQSVLTKSFIAVTDYRKYSLCYCVSFKLPKCHLLSA